MSDTIEKIDVRKISPHKKHSTIFNIYEGLDEGEAFIIINDHDPKPLRYQMAAIHGKDGFSWDYLEEGPEVWKVHIGKNDE